MPITRTGSIALLGTLGVTALLAQPKQPITTTLTTVPRLVRASSTFLPANGSAPAPVESATLSIYTAEVGGTALWQETQNVPVDRDGHYSVLLGSTRNEGLPLELFASGEPRWLGVQFQRPGEMEQPRVLLASVPYALKAMDADTLGGRPSSSYLLAEPASSSTGSTTTTLQGKTNAATPRASVGTPNFIARFFTTTDLGNSLLFDTGARVGLGTQNPLDNFHVLFNDTSGGVTGYAVQNTGSSVNSYSGMLFYDQNGKLGQFQGFNNSTHEYRINNIARSGVNGAFDGSINFMIGGSSKFNLSSAGDMGLWGSMNMGGNILKNGTLFLSGISVVASEPNAGTTSVGIGALSGNNTGAGNTASGAAALQQNTTGHSNTANGTVALGDNSSGSENTAVGNAALPNNTTGNGNTAIGNRALSAVLYTASENTALGDRAGLNIATGSYNIMIANPGDSADDHVIKIGQVQSRAFIAGIEGTTTGSHDAVPVMVDSNAQLGTVNSSRRFKEDIQDMGNTSSNLLRLRPVTYRYKQPYVDGSKPIDYGLIAEEVAEVYPDLVVRNKDGQLQTVQYQKLTPMLLNEVQKLNSELHQQHLEEEKQNQRVQQQDETIRQLQARLEALEALLSSRVPTTAHRK